MTAETEMALLDRFLKMKNPTGGDHTPTPWDKVANHIICKDGEVLASFFRQEDRDLALYFANSHPGVIALLRQMADSFEFISKGTNDAGLAKFAAEQVNMVRNYANLLSRLGRPDGDEDDKPD